MRAASSGRPARRECVQRLVEQRLGVGSAGRQRPAEGDGGEGPRPAGGLGELRQLLRPAPGGRGLLGAHCRLDPLQGPPSARGTGAGTGPGGAGRPTLSPVPAARRPLGPAGQVVHRVGRMPSGWAPCQLLELRQQEVVVVVPVLQRREQRQPGQREGGHRRLADARRRGRRPPRRCCERRRGRRPGSGRSRAAAGSRRPPSRRRPRVLATGRRSRSAAGHRRRPAGGPRCRGSTARPGRRPARPMRRGRGPGPRPPAAQSPSATCGHGDQHVLAGSASAASRPRPIAARGRRPRQRGAAVGAEGAHDGRRDADVEGSHRVERAAPRGRPRRRSGAPPRPSRC